MKPAKKQQKKKGKKEASKEQQGQSVKEKIVAGEDKKERLQEHTIREKAISKEDKGERSQEAPVQTAAVSPPSEKDDLEKILHEKKQNAYLKAVLVGMALIMILFIGFLVVRTKSKSFEYVGLQFEKTKFGQLVIYQTTIPITSVTGKAIADYNLNLRNDPRDLESIPIKGRIRMRRSVLLALDPSMEDCQDNSFAGLNLAQFLAAAGVQAKGATTNKTYAEENGVPFASCETGSELSTLVVTEKANTTQIKKETENCYKIQVASCDDLVKATERFIVGAIGHSSGYDV